MAVADLVDPNGVDLLFDPCFGVMHSVVYASGSGTNFREAILESQRRGSNFSLDLLLTDKMFKKGSRDLIGALDFASEYGISSDTVSGLEVCGSWKEAQKTVEGRLEYERKVQVFNQAMLGKVQAFEREHGFTFDLAILAGYMRLFKGTLLRRFNNRAINVHPADLSVLNTDGSRRYVGEDAVYDALKAGEKRTRSSIILVDPEIDAGAILVSGPWVGYEGSEQDSDEAWKLEADLHQGHQKQESDWPALRFALQAIANGELGLHKKKSHPDGNPVVVYKGEEMPYEGIVLETAA